MSDDSSRDSKHLIGEYEALRAEILQAQQTRLLVLGLTFSALGVVTGLGLNPARSSDAVFVTGVFAFGLVFVSGAIHLSTVLTQGVDRLGSYVAAYLEEPLGFRWEGVVRRYRHRVGAARRRFHVPWLRSALPLGVSKPLAVYYVVLITGDVVAWTAAVGTPSLVPIIIMASLTAVALFLAANLYGLFSWLPGWTALTAPSAQDVQHRIHQQPLATQAPSAKEAVSTTGSRTTDAAHESE